MRVALSVLAAYVLLSPSAWAVTYAGNPTIRITLHDPLSYVDASSVDIVGVRIYNCGGGHTDYYDSGTVDLLDSWSTVITGGNLCGARVYWDSTLVMTGTDGSSNPLELQYDEAYTDIYFAEPIGDVPLSQYKVITGSYSGGTPYLATKIEVAD
jgi:hypothetical protein